ELRTTSMLAGGAQECSEVGAHAGVERQPLARRRMRDRECARMQREPAAPTSIALEVARVSIVAEDRMAELPPANADLVAPTGLERALHVRRPTHALDDVKTRHGAFASIARRSTIEVPGRDEPGIDDAVVAVDVAGGDGVVDPLVLAPRVDQRARRLL